MALDTGPLGVSEVTGIGRTHETERTALRYVGAYPKHALIGVRAEIHVWAEIVQSWVGGSFRSRRVCLFWRRQITWIANGYRRSPTYECGTLAYPVASNRVWEM